MQVSCFDQRLNNQFLTELIETPDFEFFTDRLIK